jgi:NAD(P)-dependent dehydrogenase (short-subunit alcohol dehydrogenase family)
MLIEHAYRGPCSARAVVTGASRGIGLAVVRAAEGVDVVAGARAASDALDELNGVRTFAVDLADPDGPRQLIIAAGERFDILVNNVGSPPARQGGFLSVTDADWAGVEDRHVRRRTGGRRRGSHEDLPEVVLTVDRGDEQRVPAGLREVVQSDDERPFQPGA